MSHERRDKHTSEAQLLAAEASTISVVVPSHNGRRLLETCLPALYDDLRETDGAEVIIVDNGSSDGSVSWLRSTWPTVRVIELEQNVGYATACNIGASVARGSTVVFHNNDAIVQRGWSAALHAALNATPDTVIAGGLTLFHDDPTRVNSAGIRIAISAAATDIGFDRPVEQVELQPRDVAGVSGVSMAVRRAWFERSGGFDEAFFMYFEDADLCLRAWIEGHRVTFTPHAVVLHAFGGTSGSRHSVLRNYYGSRNRLLTAAKAFRVREMAAAISLSIAQDVAVVAWLVARRELSVAGSAALGKLRGTIAGLASTPRYFLGPRRAVRRERNLADLKELGIVDPFSASLREFVRMRSVRR